MAVSPLRPVHKDLLAAISDVRDSDIEAALAKAARILKDAGILAPEAKVERAESKGRNRQASGGFDRSEG